MIGFHVFKEDGAFIAYCPALDISTCANTKEAAIDAFFEMLQLHIETCMRNGTLKTELRNHFKYTNDL